MHQIRRRCLKINRRKPTCDAREKARRHDDQIAHPARVVADKFSPLRVVAHCVGDSSERGLREGVHRGGAEEKIDRDQVIHLNLPTEVEAQIVKPSGAASTVRIDACLTAKKLGEHQCSRKYEFTHAERNHGKRRTGFSCGDKTQQCAKAKTGETRHQWDRPHRNRPATAYFVHRMNRDKAAKARVDGVAEGEHARLPEQHVVAHAGNRGDARQAQQRNRKIGLR